jgi:hypothetical protein
LTRAIPGEDLLTKDLIDPLTFEELIELNRRNEFRRSLTFEELINMHLTRSLTFVDDAINKATQNKGVCREDIDAVLLVGGSSRIPRARTLLVDHFQRGEDFVRADADPDSVVARGAALIAHHMAPTPHAFNIREQPDETALALDTGDNWWVGRITEHSLGVRTHPDRFTKIVSQGTGIPFEKTQGGFANVGPSNEVVVQVYQGEGEYVYECAYIGELIIPVEPRPEGFHHFEVTFRMDINGLLDMTVRHVNTGKDHPKEFRQITTAGGLDALEVKHGRLVDMFGGAIPLVENVTPPPPPALVPPPGAYGAGVGASQPAPAGRPRVPPSSGLVLPKVEVPAQFKSIVRRAQRQLEKRDYPNLTSAFNAFTSALNDGVAGEELEDLGDELADAYDDTRR